ncbi:glutamate-cysteine ligase regulatory subunit [Schizosaccharomyces cryophilus OY26]|uniref:GCS light chain n=1 Tax=Schizosaccharomyces cryophilus (strain OY26 / ATCC MYA-4695 / CBS 11777 / NBRC 106824 / NRRL Y48691) TaxID=653667 RepID=S9VYE9_SCHCR|nr:glutamate-cysteine ligase regulatory subunit [Schizosaccharomyces cryophilus OY26]EPY51294.1 glutamate-cysteine ligase regulatory subunit [Schizosaccharomyces cryophilus OY26]
MGCADVKQLLLCTGDVTKNLKSGIWNTSRSASNLELIKALENGNFQELKDTGDVADSHTKIFVAPNDPLQNLDGKADDYEIIAKLFFLDGKNINVENRRETTDQVFQYLNQLLGIQEVSTLVVSFPNVAFSKKNLKDTPDSQVYSSIDQIPKEEIQSWIDTWKIFEEKVRQGKIGTLGISEFGVPELEQLIPNVEISPESTQINTGGLCELPLDLTKYTEQKRLKVFLHSDPAALIDEKEITEAIRHACPNFPIRARADWVVRYTILSRKTSVIHRKGYFVKGSLI